MKKNKSDKVFHYLDFKDMLLKTEIMIFTIELPEKYYKFLSGLNKKVKIFIPSSFKQTISVLERNGYSENLILLSTEEKHYHQWHGDDRKEGGDSHEFGGVGGVAAVFHGKEAERGGGR